MNEVTKNRTLNNIIIKFLDAHPEKKREAEELKELDSQNIIKEDVVKPKKE